VESEWDPVKASINIKKHAVDLDAAIEVLADPTCS
jgi:uncharacterized DUF497 family protein